MQYLLEIMPMLYGKNRFKTVGGVAFEKKKFSK